MSNISFRCPSCGGTEFSAASQPKSYDDLDGASCVKCGRKLTKNDIERKATEVAAKLIKDTLKRARF